MSGARLWVQLFAGAALVAGGIASVTAVLWAQEQPAGQQMRLPTSKVLLTPVPGNPQRTNSLPTATVVSPDGRYVAILNNGNGSIESYYSESIAVLDLETNQLTDFPESRLGLLMHQTYFIGLGFSADGHALYASIASMTDPEGARAGDTGNGIAVYRFDRGRVTPERFISIPLQPLGPNQKTEISTNLAPGKAISFPSGLAVLTQAGRERILVADDLSDDALLIDAGSGGIIHRFDLSAHDTVPSTYPYTVVAARDGKRAWVSLWNASEVDELDLDGGKVIRKISLLAPASATSPGSHPTALLLSPDEKRLYVALANADRVAVVDTASGEVAALLSTELPGQTYLGTYPNALALKGDRLYAADAAADAVAVFDVSRLKSASAGPIAALGFIPTEWYPTALAIEGDDLFVATGKGQGTGPNSSIVEFSPGTGVPLGPNRSYISALIHGSLARIDVRKAERERSKLTQDAIVSNRMEKHVAPLRFASGKNPIDHVIYILKENRSYDQVYGDLKEANGDPSLVMYGQSITPNQHALARQFGILDNFYVSAETSANGHVWSTAAITSDYTEKTWEISYRGFPGGERLYDYLGNVSNGIPLQQGIPDVDDPGTGFLWGDVARSGLSYRHYSEFVNTEWCNDPAAVSKFAGDPATAGRVCAKAFIKPGEPLPSNVGRPHGAKSPYHWPIPMFAGDVPTKPELVGHFDPRSPGFQLLYPDQLRADEFLNEFAGFAQARREGRTSAELPQFVLLYLPQDHTFGAFPGTPTPEAAVADNDLAVGRVVDAVSHSAYWADTAIFVVEDDAQDGPDHVDAHRSGALVISKYAPSGTGRSFVDHGLYTTVNLIRTWRCCSACLP
jgi:DNA-binding beta-propeller fold protein YncE